MLIAFVFNLQRAINNLIFKAMEKPLAQSIPTSPGVYIYKDKNNKIIYIGKAINLRKRVFSYFRPEHTLTPKTSLMMSHAVSIETLTTTTEKEALLLEASLIKKHHPRFNIVLRDDKQYVLFKISNKDKYPRLEITRSVKKDNAKYYGPFTSGQLARETWKNIHRLFPLRRCSDKAFNNRVRPCLYHFMQQCLAPCTLDVPIEEYKKVVHKVNLLLSGRSNELREEITELMLKASEELDYEQAGIYRDQLQAIEKTLEQQSAVLTDGADRDVLALIQSKFGLSLGLVFVRNGMMIDSRAFHWQGLDFAEAHELLLSFLVQFYSNAYIPEHIILPFLPESMEQEENEEKERSELELLAQSFTEMRAQNLNIPANKNIAQVRIRLARDAKENRLIEIAQSNAKESLRNKTEKPIGEMLAPYFADKNSNREELKSIERIECVDVSHTFGQATKVGMVVFENGSEAKEDYRAWNIDANGDDYLALAKWAELRIERTHKGRANFPDLILIDGGKGQLSTVYKALLETYQTMVDSAAEDLPFYVASIAKARDEEGKQDRRAGNVSDRIFLPNRSNPINMKAGSQELLYLQKVRDAAHNFSIRKHRQARTKIALTSELQRLQGFGEKTIEALFAHFNTIEEIIKASPEDLAQVPSISKKRALDIHAKLEIFRN